MTDALDPLRDLVFEREVDLPPHQLWRAWTTPELVKQWFTPAPWKTLACELDLRPGGAFRTVMRSPEGESFPQEGCILEVVPESRLVWTTALGPGFRPAVRPVPGPCVTVVLTFEPTATGTRYRAVLRHDDAEGREAHEAMGFQEGWGLAFEQLMAVLRGPRFS